MKKKIIGFSCFILLIIGLLFTWRDRNGFSIGDEVVRMLGLKAWSNDEKNLGLHYTTFYSFALIIFSYWGAVHFLKQSFPKIKRKMLLFFFLLLVVVNPMLGNKAKDIYYNWNSGLKAIEYFPNESSCSVYRYDLVDNTNAMIKCNLFFRNYEKEEQTFQIFWKDEEDFKAGQLKLENKTPQNIFTIGPLEQKKIRVDFKIENSQLQIYSGETHGPTLLLVNNKEQELKKSH